MRRYIKLSIVIVLFLLVTITANNVSAKEIYFTNDNGVSLSKEEYDFFKQLYWDGFPELLTLEKYEQFVSMDFLNAEYEYSTTQNINKIGDQYSPRGTYHSTGAKSIRISKVCSNNCVIVTVAEWFGTPSVKSYDVIGAYLYNSTRIGTPTTIISSSTTSYSSNSIKYDTNGFGTSFLLPQSGNSYVISQDFLTTYSGHIYASYQHAASTSSLTISQSYNISLTGFGGVFGFYGQAYNIYDGMQGVDIVL